MLEVHLALTLALRMQNSKNEWMLYTAFIWMAKRNTRRSRYIRTRICWDRHAHASHQAIKIAIHIYGSRKIHSFIHGHSYTYPVFTVRLLCCRCCYIRYAKWNAHAHGLANKYVQVQAISSIHYCRSHVVLRRTATTTASSICINIFSLRTRYPFVIRSFVRSFRFTLCRQIRYAFSTLSSKFHSHFLLQHQHTYLCRQQTDHVQVFAISRA